MLPGKLAHIENVFTEFPDVRYEDEHIVFTAGSGEYTIVL